MSIIVQVKTGSSQEKIIQNPPDSQVNLIVYIREKPHDGLANQKLIRLLSKHFNLPKTQITITKGLKSKIKTISLG